MHVAILALNMGVPAIAIETMGKVQGLYAMFNLEKYCIDRTANFSNEVIQRIDLLEKEYSPVCRLIQVAIPEVRRLSNINFADLN
jgi:polysaccharide pyruvyl transferase WcaK-like protein